MYDFKKLKRGNKVKVKKLIEELEKLDTNSTILICGSDEFFIHVDEDNRIISLDHDSLLDDGIYPDNLEENDIYNI